MVGWIVLAVVIYLVVVGFLLDSTNPNKGPVFIWGLLWPLIAILLSCAYLAGK